MDCLIRSVFVINSFGQFVVVVLSGRCRVLVEEGIGRVAWVPGLLLHCSRVNRCSKSCDRLAGRGRFVYIISLKNFNIAIQPY